MLTLLPGHQPDINDRLISENIPELRPKIVELTTCGCRITTKYDQAAKRLSSSGLLLNDNLNNGNGEKGSEGDKIEFRSRIAQYGTFRCSSISTGCVNNNPNVIGWYRTCLNCSQQYCVKCSSGWNWSNEFILDKSNKCSCSYCIDRDQLVLQCYGHISNDGKGNIGTSVVIANDATSVAVGSLPTQMNTTNSNTNNTSTITAAVATMIIPPRYSCSVHCKNCSFKGPLK
jgi:hypothetical protein